MIRSEYSKIYFYLTFGIFLFLFIFFFKNGVFPFFQNTSGQRKEKNQNIFNLPKVSRTYFKLSKFCSDLDIGTLMVEGRNKRRKYRIN